MKERFDAYVERCLYLEGDGFYASHGNAGRRSGDFITSPEVGPLFGQVVARSLDSTWHELGRPDQFTFLEAGSGRGALWTAVLRSELECRASLRVVSVERSSRLRDQQKQLLQTSDVDVSVEIRADLPSEPFVGLAFANELLDNLAFRIVERSDTGWNELFVHTGEDGGRSWLTEPFTGSGRSEAQQVVELIPEEATRGARFPICDAARAWVEQAVEVVERGRIVLIDYGVRTTAELIDRQWLRTYRDHVRGDDPLLEAGMRDITIDVPFDQLPGSPEFSSQADYLTRHGISELVEQGRRVWLERAHLGDLEAIRARSRVAEGEALCDPDGLGGFIVAEWIR